MTADRVLEILREVEYSYRKKANEWNEERAEVGGKSIGYFNEIADAMRDAAVMIQYARELKIPLER